MPSQVFEIKEFLLLCRSPAVKGLVIHRNLAHKNKITKFKLRTKHRLYTMVVKSKEKAAKIQTSIPQDLQKKAKYIGDKPKDEGKKAKKVAKKVEKKEEKPVEQKTA